MAKETQSGLHFATVTNADKTRAIQQKISDLVSIIGLTLEIPERDQQKLFEQKIGRGANFLLAYLSGKPVGFAEFKIGRELLISSGTIVHKNHLDANIAEALHVWLADFASRKNLIFRRIHKTLPPRKRTQKPATKPDSKSRRFRRR